MAQLVGLPGEFAQVPHVPGFLFWATRGFGQAFLLRTWPLNRLDITFPDPATIADGDTFTIETLQTGETVVEMDKVPNGGTGDVVVDIFGAGSATAVRNAVATELGKEFENRRVDWIAVSHPTAGDKLRIFFPPFQRFAFGDAGTWAPVFSGGLTPNPEQGGSALYQLLASSARAFVSQNLDPASAHRATNALSTIPRNRFPSWFALPGRGGPRRSVRMTSFGWAYGPLAG